MADNNRQENYQFWYEVVTLNIRTNELLIQLLPEIVKNVENATEALTDKFKILSETAKEQSGLIENVIATIDKQLPNSSVEHTKFLKEALEQESLNAAKISDTISKMVVDIQFQDQVSQSITALASSLQILSEPLEQVRSEIVLNLKDEGKHKIHSSTAIKLVNSLKLAEMRNAFILNLIKCNHIENHKEIIDIKEFINPTDKDDELF